MKQFTPNRTSPTQTSNVFRSHRHRTTEALLTADEQQLIREVLSGRTESFRWLVERYQGPVFRLTRNLIPDAHECEDIAQDVFLTVLAKLSTYDAARSKFSTWLFTIVRNKCLNHLKRNRPTVGDVGRNGAYRRTPADEVTAQEFHQRLDAALAELPVEQRTAFVLAEIEGLGYAEVAQIEQTKLGTVKSRIARAKKHLRSVFKYEVERP